MHILLVDDDRDVRSMTTLLLEHLGHSVDQACNGLRAVQRAAARAPDAIFLDLNMPVMDGFTAARELRQQPATAKTPIFALSAYVHDSEWCNRAKAAGVDACFGKPIEVDKLAALLERQATLRK